MGGIDLDGGKQDSLLDNSQVQAMAFSLGNVIHEPDTRFKDLIPGKSMEKVCDPINLFPGLSPIKKGLC